MRFPLDKSRRDVDDVSFISKFEWFFHEDRLYIPSDDPLHDSSTPV